jgi:serine/threonine protein kinase
MISDHIKFAEIQFCGTLGHGAFSSVKLVRVPNATQPTGRYRTGMVLGDHEYFAMKVMARSYIVDNGWEELVVSERAAMVEIENFGGTAKAERRRRFTLGLHHAFVDDLCVYLMVDLCAGGELYDFCKSQEHGYVTSTEARFFAACIALALQEVHGCDMIYRDLKLENIIFDSRGYLIMADFGLAKKTTRTYTVCGTPEYMAPEVILSTGHDRAIDLWALGISIFEILCGATPFAGGSPMETYENIVQFEDFSKHNKASFYAGTRMKRANNLGEDNLPWHICDNNIDDDARDVVRRLLLKGKRLRLGGRSKTLDSLIGHQYFDGLDWTALAAQELDVSEIPYFPPAMDTSRFDGKTVPLKVHVERTEGAVSGIFVDRSGWLPDGFQRVQ